MNNNELQKPIFPLTSGQKTPAKTAVGFSDPANYEKLRSLCKPGENYGLLMGKNTGLFCLDFDLYKSGKKYTLENFKEQFSDNVYVTETPRGGFHVVFEYEPRTDTWSQVTGIDGYLDTRTTGAFFTVLRVIECSSCMGLRTDQVSVKIRAWKRIFVLRALSHKREGR